jgi:hypothetical protein
MNSIIENSRSDWNKLLDENNIKYEDLKKILNSEEFRRQAGEVINKKNDFYFKDKSNIHGSGIFAKKHISKDDIIGVVSSSGSEKYRTYLGRFTNHSNTSNVVFRELKPGKVFAISTENIKLGEEILVNYRDQTPK